MTTLITGGTGALGRELTAQLLASGAEVRVLSRRPRRPTDPPAATWAVGDLRTGAGLDAALRGADVVVHCASNPRRPRGDLPAAQHLIDAAQRAGHPHLIYISIVGVDRISYGYYQVKLAVERLIEDSGLPWTVLRATQFHDLICYLLQWAAKLPVMPLPAGVSFQPVDTRDVATRLTTLAQAAPLGRAPDFGGPRIEPLPTLARAWLTATARHRRLATLPFPAPLFRGFQAGHHLTPAHPDGTITFTDFLTHHLTPTHHTVPYGHLPLP